MAKKRKNNKNQKHQKEWKQTENLVPITEAQVGDLRTWLDRMQTHLGKAIVLSEHLDGNALSEDDDRFWALVKYVENVQECAIALDRMKRSIFEALEEIPMISEQGTELNWSGLKGMRIKLAHKFWDIDPKILWVTVTQDFPVLRTLLSLLVVANWSADPDSDHFSLPVENYIHLPLSKADDEFTLGNSIIIISFNKRGRARCMRIKKLSDRRFMVKPPDDVDGYELSLYLDGGEEREHLGHFVNMPNP